MRTQAPALPPLEQAPIRPSYARMERVLIVLIVVLLAVGAWQAGRGVWIHAKALLAQALIASAWDRTLAEGAPVRPWPWADTWPVARLSVPRLGVVRYVLAGSGGAALAFGPGHVTGTAHPGDGGNSVIAGHRDTHFSFLQEVRIGDEMVVERPDGTRVRYRVGDARILDRRSTWVMEQAGPSRLTLVTCYPFGALRAGGPERYVLLAFLS
ncbi:MAG TPA: class GN sortase [Burkholderiales bacterium]|nr:class GN sortase [Burkholderiales bacterium]